MLSGSINPSKLSKSFNNSLNMAASLSGKTPQKVGKLRCRNVTQTSIPSGGDRFIPNRASTNYDLGHYKIRVEQLRHINDETNSNKPNIESNFEKIMAENFQGGNIDNQNIFSYREKAREFLQIPLHVACPMKTSMSIKNGTRIIPTSPDRILEAPCFINDYYLNLLDWSSQNIVTVALGNVVYLWNAGTGSIEQLRTYRERDHACSLAWAQENDHILAIGYNDGTVELWDCVVKKRLGVMDGHNARVGALAWNSFLITSGSRDSTIIHHDGRQRDHYVSKLTGHTEEVCGLKWSTDHKYLASGGNDNLVNIWPAAKRSNGHEPLYKLTDHQAAVRALAWSPHKSGLLATGGGTTDCCIKFWNVNNGTMTSSVNSKSQVSALLWSKTYKEIISAHCNNQLTIWKYPTMAKQAELRGHTSRVLQIAMSPDGSTVASAAADNTLCTWNCFIPDSKQVKVEKNATLTKHSVFTQRIR